MCCMFMRNFGCPWIFRWNNLKGDVLGKFSLAYLEAELKKRMLYWTGVGVSDGKALFLHKPHKQAVHRMGVIANRIT